VPAAPAPAAAAAAAAAAAPAALAAAAPAITPAANATAAAAAVAVRAGGGSGLKRFGEPCAPPGSVLEPSPCREDLYCSVSKRTCEKRVAKGGACAAYLPNRSCQKGLYCKPLKANANRTRAPGKCVPQIPSVYQEGYMEAGCDQSGPDDQCAPGGKGGAEFFECTLPPWCSVSAPWFPFCQRPVPADACANTTSFETMLP
jgi:hypothetical protein